MKLLEKMALDYARPMIEGERLPDGPFQRSIANAYEAGFLKARLMAATTAERHPNEAGDKPYGFCSVCGGGPEIAKQIETIGEKEHSA